MKKLRAHFKKISEVISYFKRIVKILSSAGKPYLVVIIVLAIIFGVIPGISILVMQEIVNTLQASERSFEYIMRLVAIYVGIDIFSGVMGLISGYVEGIVQMKAGITLNVSVLEKVKELNLKDFENSETYNLIQRAVGTGINSMFSFFKSFIHVFQSLINLVVFSLILITLRWWLLPVIFFMPIISTFVTAYFGKKQFLIQRNRAGEARKQWYSQFLLTNDIAFKEIKIFNIGDYFRNKYKQLSYKFLAQDRKILNQRTAAQSGLLLIDQIISAGLFVFVIARTFVGEILLGDLITFTRSISNVKSSTQGVLGQVNSIYQNVLYISQYFEFIDMKSEVEIASNESQSLSEIPFIEINNLSYRYKNKSQYALQNINIRIEKNNLVAFIGQNGSGKTTLVKILSTLYNDYQGNVYFGEQNLRDINPETIKKKIGLLFQDYVKYELSAKENVALGQLEKIDDDVAIGRALSKTGMQEKLSDLDMQLGHWFDNGVQLSGGEWLRVALSRAFIRDADLYLLDEPNSALDSVSERKVLESFKELVSGKIGIIISHRIASIKNIADKIVVFDNGTIQAVGTHDELIESSKVYRELYEQESGDTYVVKP